MWLTRIISTTLGSRQKILLSEMVICTYYVYLNITQTKQSFVSFWILAISDSFESLNQLVASIKLLNYSPFVICLFFLYGFTTYSLSKISLASKKSGMKWKYGSWCMFLWRANNLKNCKREEFSQYQPRYHQPSKTILPSLSNYFWKIHIRDSGRFREDEGNES